MIPTGSVRLALPLGVGGLATSRNNTCVMFINQLRQKIGVVYGNPETTTGGNALEFYASVRLDIRKIGVVKNGEQAVGSKTRVKVVKNRVAPPLPPRLWGTGPNHRCAVGLGRPKPGVGIDPSPLFCSSSCLLLEGGIREQVSLLMCRLRWWRCGA